MKNRKYPRLKNHDYRTNGAYFITLVCHRRAPLFGLFIATEFCLTPIGDYAIKAWQALSQRDTAITLDAFVLMPNHLHGIIWLNESTHRSLLNIVNWFKAEITRETGIKVWQRSFYDRVIRDEHELLNIRRYIEENPMKWELDRLYVSGKP
ncbi:transposase [Pantoea sp. NPDC088449]|uniref:transposase n=2 Tax=unclassified Pantoea TaxID=2630326 RepID=UPI003805D0F0